MTFSGHFPQVLGDDAENDFNLLLRALGYTIIRRRNLSPGIDFIADFSGTVGGRTSLLRPVYSPNGPSAFSVKRGNAQEGDVSDLEGYLASARASADPTLQTIVGGVLVAGALIGEPTLNSYQQRGIYCWDIRRLVFYAYKARLVAQSISSEPITEYRLEGIPGTYLIRSMRRLGTLEFMEVHVFIDDHMLEIHRDHVVSILEDVYGVGLRPRVEATHYDVQVTLSVHSVGPVQAQLVLDAYQDFSGDQSRHPGVFFPAATEVKIQAYSGAPWTAILRA